MKTDRHASSAPATQERPAPSPENEAGIPLHAIAQRAYELYVASGSQHGRDVEHWLEAERRVRTRAPRREDR